MENVKEALDAIERTVEMGWTDKESRLWTLEDFMASYTSLVTLYPAFPPSLNSAVDKMTSPDVAILKDHYLKSLHALYERWSLFFAPPVSAETHSARSPESHAVASAA